MARLSQAEVGILGAAAVGVLGLLTSRRTAPGTAPAPVPVPVANTGEQTRSLVQQGTKRSRMPLTRIDRSGGSPHVRAARRLNRAAGLLATSVLTDSAVEHYRGSFQNRAMYAPLITAALSLAVSMQGVSDERSGAHAVRDTVYALAGLTGTVGTGFHIYNVTKRPGGFSWMNLFYGAPLGAPFALVLSGLLGFTAERVRENQPGVTPSILGFPAGRAMAAVSSLGMLGTVGEASLLHFRGAFHDPAMFLPVTVPPVAAGLLADTAVVPGTPRRGLTRWWLRLTAAVGLAGVGFHIFGVARNMGGWRNWSQNVLNGPPIPAPPSFTGLALAGLAALGLLEEHPDA